MNLGERNSINVDVRVSCEAQRNTERLNKEAVFGNTCISGPAKFWLKFRHSVYVKAVIIGTALLEFIRLQKQAQFQGLHPPVL